MERKSKLNRRSMLKTLGIGTAALGIPGYVLGAEKKSIPVNGMRGKKATYEKIISPSKVSLIKGNDARDNMFKALMNIEDEIMTSLERKKRILIKPNLVIINNPLCATNVNAVRGILDFLKPRFKGSIEIGESTASGAMNPRRKAEGLTNDPVTQGTFAGYKNYGYLPLEKEYGIKLTDLNLDSHVNRYVFNSNGNRPMPLRIISKFLDTDTYLISAAKMKTHNCVLVTLSLKNVLMAAPLNDYKTQNDKLIMHSVPDAEAKAGRYFDNPKKDMPLHFNLFQIAQEVYPDLGIIDGFESMEGDGPVSGTPVDSRIALASLDPLALDTLGTKIMGFDPKEVLYLSSLNEAGMGQGDLDKIQIIGADVNTCLFKFKPNKNLIEPYSLG